MIHLFERSSEACFLRDRMCEIGPTRSAMFKNPNLYENMERLAKTMWEWPERRVQGSATTWPRVISPRPAASVKAGAE